MNWTEIFQRGCNSFFDWGPGMLIALVVLYGLYHLIRGIGLKIVMALERPAGSLDRQAESMAKLTDSIQAFVERDRSEHREIIILQKVLVERFDHLENRLTREKNGRNQEREIPKD
jgi:hypothetical protein